LKVSAALAYDPPSPPPGFSFVKGWRAVRSSARAIAAVGVSTFVAGSAGRATCLVLTAITTDGTTSLVCELA
jgi:hypothetical protein